LVATVLDDEGRSVSIPIVPLDKLVLLSYAAKPRIAMVVLTLKAKHDHLQKVASTRDHVKAISEFVWNALAADAKRTLVEFTRNALGGLEGIIIRDNGTGISKERAEHDFESLGESWKLTKARTPVLARAIHGKEGQGRLRFFEQLLVLFVNRVPLRVSG
jgi:hypothetical protein